LYTSFVAQTSTSCLTVVYRKYRLSFGLA
jgi:hypothetical protein